MNKKKKFDSRKGILFWVTGLPGSGKTAIAKKLNVPLEEYAKQLDIVKESI